MSDKLSNLDKEQADSKPPQPPEIERRFQFHRLQKIGIPLILLLPILALIGVFGEDSNLVNVSSSQLVLEVEYPTRFRYKMIDHIQVSIQNSSTQMFSTVTVYFDRAYVDSFSNVMFIPSVTHITDADYVLGITSLPPQETRVIALEIRGEKYGRHQGTVTAVPDEGEGVTVPLDTFVFP